MLDYHFLCFLFINLIFKFLFMFPIYYFYLSDSSWYLFIFLDHFIHHVRAHQSDGDPSRFDTFVSVSIFDFTKASINEPPPLSSPNLPNINYILLSNDD